MTIPFNDFKAHYAAVRQLVDPAIARVLASGWYILGKEVSGFEEALAGYLGSRHVIGVANGTEAIALALMALGIGAGDEVITTDMTAYPTITGIKQAGATPIVIDIEADTGLMNAALLKAAVTPRTRAIVPVHLYGQSCDLAAILAVAKEHRLAVVEDCAQAIGATFAGRRTGTCGALGCFSFYPTKNLGAFGDGGAICTDSDDLAASLRQLRNYGQTSRYRHDSRGINSRLDEVQAAVLAAKLPLLEASNQRRRELAARYDAGLRGVTPPARRGYGEPVYHLYPVLCTEREALMAFLKERAIATLIHYPIPVHRQRDFGAGDTVSCPVADAFADRILSLPIYPELTFDQVDEVIAGVNDFYAKC